MRHSLKGVGENLRDHYPARLVGEVNVKTVNERVRGLNVVYEALKYAATRKGILGLSPTLVHCFWKSNEALDAGDLDGDGDVDIAAGSFGGYGPDKALKRKLFWYENDGKGQFQTHELDTENGQESYALEIVDVDADGRNDILVGGRGSVNVVWYRSKMK